MNLHIVNDEKFINGAITLFEKYKPNQNIFVVNTEDYKLKYVERDNNVFFLRLAVKSDFKQVFYIAKKNKIKNVFVHSLDPLKAVISNQLKKKYKIKTFWIFYGADLYILLNENYGYELVDEQKIMYNNFLSYIRSKLSSLKFRLLYKDTPYKSFLNYVKTLDYFCFWNNYDYELLNKYYETKAVHLDFIYFNAISRDLKPLKMFDSVTVMVNNSASTNGNHKTILNKIHRIDNNKTIRKIIVPLSYGDKEVSEGICEFGKELFDERFNPIIEFMNMNSYFSLLDNVSVAFFGARRQEAAGNVIQLLSKGVKVFLRNDNNMMKYFKDNGFIIFSFENDFNSLDDLKPLKIKEMEKNRTAFLKTFGKEKEVEVMKKLLSI